MSLFNPTIPASDQIYVSLRDYAHFADARFHVEELWKRFEPFADTQFKREIAIQFHPRYWEMYLGCLILDAGLSIAPSREGRPDICGTLPSGRHFYIEAIAPGSGTSDDAVPEPESFAGTIPVDKIVLRIRSAIEKKFEAHGIYLEKNFVSTDDLYIIAVNPGIIRHTCINFDPPLILQALFPIGNLIDMFDRNDPSLRDVTYTTRWQIERKVGPAIRTDVFLDSSYCGLSAVLFSNAYAPTPPRPIGTEVELVHNPQAVNRIDRGFLKMGSEYWLEGNRLRSQDWNIENR